MLSEGKDPEHTQTFRDVIPTLGDLRWVFHAIVQVLERYELFRVRSYVGGLLFSMTNLHIRQTAGSWCR